MNELYKLHRPAKLSEVIGQPDAVRVIRNAFKDKNVCDQHTWVFTGPSGCGKTTLARIIGTMLGCDPNDFFEFNGADFRGIDTIREIRSQMGFSGLSKNKTRIYYLDEMHQMTTHAQQAMLKMLEDTPGHVYFLLASSEPNKIIKAIHTRCTEIRLNPIKPNDLKTIIEEVAKKAKIKLLSKVVMNNLVNAADGSARKALVILQTLQGIKSEDNQLSAIEKNDSKSPAIAIARALLNPQTRWMEMAKILKENGTEDVEGMRHMVLGYCKTILLSGRADKRAAYLIEEFQDNLFDSKWPGFVLRCFNVLHLAK